MSVASTSIKPLLCASQDLSLSTWIHHLSAKWSKYIFQKVRAVENFVPVNYRAIMVLSRLESPKDKTLLLTTDRWRLSNSPLDLSVSNQNIFVGDSSFDLQQRRIRWQAVGVLLARRRFVEHFLTLAIMWMASTQFNQSFWFLVRKLCSLDGRSPSLFIFPHLVLGAGASFIIIILALWAGFKF